MAKYHVNAETGRSGICRAPEGECPLKGPDGEKPAQHFKDKATADAYAEGLNAARTAGKEKEAYRKPSSAQVSSYRQAVAKLQGEHVELVKVATQAEKLLKHANRSKHYTDTEKKELENAVKTFEKLQELSTKKQEKFVADRPDLERESKRIDTIAENKRLEAERYRKEHPMSYSSCAGGGSRYRSC